MKNLWQHPWTSISGLILAGANLSLNGTSIKQIVLAALVQLALGFAKDK